MYSQTVHRTLFNSAGRTFGVNKWIQSNQYPWTIIVLHNEVTRKDWPHPYLWTTRWDCGFNCIADIIDECRTKSSAAMRNDGTTVCGHGFIVLWLPVRFPWAAFESGHNDPDIAIWLGNNIKPSACHTKEDWFWRMANWLQWSCF